jgi:hypothetical protein
MAGCVKNFLGATRQTLPQPVARALLPTLLPWLWVATL